jgi:predicted HicB family RNase H-like nuclease
MKKLLSYRGFYGSINYSTKDNLLYGKIENIKALVNYEGQSFKELESSFHEAVDDYLETCNILGYNVEEN